MFATDFNLPPNILGLKRSQSKLRVKHVILATRASCKATLWTSPYSVLPGFMAKNIHTSTQPRCGVGWSHGPGSTIGGKKRVENFP